MPLPASDFVLTGWRFEGIFPNLPKAIYIVVPHTSNWDFLVGISTIFALRLRVSYLGKHTVFRWPLGILMTWLGGIPVDRDSAKDVVTQVAERFRSSDKLLLALSPEGTRSQVTRWKTGFHRIALETGVPIVPVSPDYSQKLVRFGLPMEPTADLAADLHYLEDFFAGSVGRRIYRDIE